MENFLNPFFEGKLVQKYGDLDSLKRDLIENHPSRKEFVQQVRQQIEQASFNEMDEAEMVAAEMSGEGDDFFKISADQGRQLIGCKFLAL